MTQCPYTPRDLDRLLALEPELVRCPFPLYDVLREQAPVTFNAKLNGYVVTRYDDILEVLRDAVTFSSAMASGPTSVTGLAKQLLADPAITPRLREQAERRVKLAESPVLLFSDPPLHKRQRQLVSAAFSPKRVKELEPEVRRLVNELIDGFISDGRVDLVPAFSIPLPMTVIATLLGIPPAEMDQFKRWSNAFTQGIGSIEQDREAIARLFAEVDSFYDYFTAQIERRRIAPEEDLLTDLVAARMDGSEPLSLDEMLQMLSQFLVAGNETTTNATTTMVWKLAQNPELAERVRGNAALCGALVEELLRIEAPVQGMFRVTTVDAVVGGVDIPAGSLVWLVYGSANRDPHAFPEPDAIALEGERAPHLTFARFEHFCLGASIARLELRVATEILLERMGDLRLDVDPATIAYSRSFVLRGIESLPITFTAR